MVEVLIEGKRLDVFEGLDFSFNYSIADVRDPSKRNTEYSKTIQCPSTPNNDALFGHIYDVNISNPYNANAVNTGLNYNPNKKAEARVVADGIEVMSGVMQLRKITMNGTNYTYEVVFIGKLINIFSELEDKELNGLDDNGNPYIDFSDLDHQYDYGRITSSWTNTSGYVYPMIDWGVNAPSFNSAGQRRYTVTDFRPSVFLYDIIDRVFAYAGFTYTSTFFNSAFFKNLIIPFNNEGFKLTDQEIQSREMVAALPTTQDITTDVQNDFVALLNFDGSTDPYNLWNDAGDYYECPASGFYTFSAVLTFETERTAVGQLSSYPFALGLRKYDLSSNSVFSLSSYAASANVSLSQFVGATAQTQISFESQQVYLDAGDRIYLYLSVDPIQFQIADQQADLRMIQPSTFEASVGDDAIIEGQTIPMNALVPDVAMKDLLMSIVNMFNLYILPDPNNEKNLLIETRDDFYAAGSVKDWTHKLDRGQKITVQPLAMLKDKNYLYTYSEDGDYYNKRYENSFGRTYGSLKAIVDNDFLQSTNEISVVFSATPLTNDNPSNRIIARIYDEDADEEVKETETNIRILYYGGLLPSNPVWTFRYNQQTQNGTQIITVNQSQYPYAGHWNNPLTPTQDINFGLTRELYYSPNAYTGTITVTNANLFNVFHRNQFVETTSKDSKMMTGEFVLTPLDIFRLDFRDQILIDNSYWRINRVSDYNPFKDGTTTVELIKIIEREAVKIDTLTLGRPQTTTQGEVLSDIPVVRGLKRSSNVFPSFQGNVKGKANSIGFSATNFSIVGNGNSIGEGTDNITIIGNDNTVEAGLHNVVLINTNGVTVRQSNMTYRDNKEQWSAKILDGGFNTVRPLKSGGNIFTVDGGLNMVSEQFSEYDISLIDGNAG